MDVDFTDWKEYLSPNEKDIIDKLNKNSNIVQEYKADKKKLSNKTLETLYVRWSSIMTEVIDDIVEQITKINKNKKKYKKNWWVKYLDIAKELGIIFTKRDRIFYVGVTFIILSLVIHFVMVS